MVDAIPKIVTMLFFVVATITFVQFHKDYSNFLADNFKVLKEIEPWKPPTTKTDKNAYNFTVAICIIVKDSELYLQEWIDYNLLGLNFDNIYIYDNSDDFELQRWYLNTRAHSQYSRVDVIHYPNEKLKKDEKKTIQTQAYRECTETYGKKGPKHDYIAFIDYDEYIVLQQPQKHDTIHDLLAEYLHPFVDAGALALNWIYFGSANRTIYSSIPLTKRFQYRDAKPIGIVKSIVKSSNVVNFRHPHAGEYRPGTNIYDTSNPGAIAQIGNDSVGSAMGRKVADVALVYHYRFMSDKEFFQKRCMRGSISNRPLGCGEEVKNTNFANVPHHLRPRIGQVFDDKAWKFLTRKVPKYKIFDTDEYMNDYF